MRAHGNSEGNYIGMGWLEALEQVKKSKTPMLFTHGGNDTYVPTEMIYRLIIL